MKKIIFTAVCALLAFSTAQARELKSVGITVGSLGNPYFVAMVNGAKAEAQHINPAAKFTSVSADYDLNKQFTQIDNFISSGVDLILVNAVDPVAIAPAIAKARKAGIVVVGVDVMVQGANATVQTDNVEAGRIVCQYISEKLGGKGNVIIQNGTQTSAVLDRVNGCKSVFAQAPDIKVLSDNQDAKGSREGGYSVMQGDLTRFAKIDAVFAINDPQAIGADLAAKQLKRKGIIIASVDGAPDIETALKSDTQIQASASQSPWGQAQQAVTMGNDLLNGKSLESTTVLLQPSLVTRTNVMEYKGWQADQ
ncbi:ABC transporter [Pseudomonas frederiksbergensis]|uniref:ABC transporter n=1 Tax=Pseudomonas frederiksbergensis TaxID=104087 RepID=A0A2S8H8Q3_9PSED|nr:ABC transporter substrate-binding protein [Pseudomonas frederiksbergensis]PQO98848.1 ABC transporter [Pseudomonas frederiksbergensis]